MKKATKENSCLVRFTIPATATSIRMGEFNETLARAVGGFTRTGGKGGWVNDEGELIVESVFVYDVTLIDNADGIDYSKLMLVIGTMLEQLGEDATYIQTTFDGKVSTIIRPPEEVVEIAKDFLHL